MGKKYLVGIFNNEDSLITAIKNSHEKNYHIEEAYSPYPIHGLDDVIGNRRSRLPIVAFIVGAFGATFAMSFQIWTLTTDWAINVGGKPGMAIPSFVPITFELMVLTGALSMVAAFLFRNRLFPRIKMDVIDTRVTNDMFALVISDEEHSLTDIEKLLKESGAVEVNEKEV